MIKSEHNLLWMLILPITLTLATSGCATKKFVRNETGAVNQRVSQLEAKTHQQMAAMSAKEKADISRVDERITTTDNKVAEVATATQQANATAAQATELAQATHIRTETNAKDIAALATLTDNAWNFQLIEKGDVTFGFNKSALDDGAMMALDVIAEKAKAMPRAVIELQGFTDKVGSKEYNLGLSRRRAEAVARYLVGKNVPLRNVHVIGLGAEAPPPGLMADMAAVDPNATTKDAQRLARRVYIRVYAPATSIAGEAARSEP